MFDKKHSMFFFVLLGLFVTDRCIAECVLSNSQVTTLYFGVEIDLPDPEHPHTIPTAHTDIEMPLRFNTGWDIYVNTDLPTTNTRVETEDALFALGQQHRQSFPGTVPETFEFIGTSPGQTFWYYNQFEAPSPGLDSQAVSPAEKAELCLWDPNDPSGNASGLGEWLQVNLVDVRGPAGGYISMFQEGATPTVFYSTFDGGITASDVYFIKTNSHSHNSWTFTQPGLYEVDIRVSTYYQCDDTLTTDLNDDCFVNMEDYAILSSYWLRTDCGDPNLCPELSSLTDPNEIEIEDLNELSEQWLICGSPFVSECP